MCKIVGYIGEKDASNVLLSGLKRLDYRRYDSAAMSPASEVARLINRATSPRA